MTILQTLLAWTNGPQTLYYTNGRTTKLDAHTYNIHKCFYTEYKIILYWFIIALQFCSPHNVIFVEYWKKNIGYEMQQALGFSSLKSWGGGGLWIFLAISTWL